MAQVTGRGPERQPLPVIVTRIEPNDGLINANDVWVREPATDTASNGIVATLAGKHCGKKERNKKRKGCLQGVDRDCCTPSSAQSPTYVISQGRLPSTSHPPTCLSSPAKLGAPAANR